MIIVMIIIYMVQITLIANYATICIVIIATEYFSITIKFGGVNWEMYCTCTIP